MDSLSWSISIFKYSQLDLLHYLHGGRFKPRKINFDQQHLKICNFCGIAQAPSCYDSIYKKDKEYKRNECRSCRTKKDESYQKFIRRAHTKLKHGRKKQGIKWDLTPEILIEIYEDQKGLCYLTGRKMTHTLGEGVKDTNISIDRIDPGRGYEKSNISLCCVRANLIKHKLTNSELKDWTEAIWQHLQNDKNYS